MSEGKRRSERSQGDSRTDQVGACALSVLGKNQGPQGEEKQDQGCGLAMNKTNILAQGPVICALSF